MRQVVAVTAVVVAVVAWIGRGTGYAAPQTWTGYVSDSQCGNDHGGEVDPRECTLKCVAAGDKYVLVTDSGGTITPIANQDFPALREFAGKEAKVTGELSGGSITVSKIEQP
jgi:hypothetical protein